MSRPPNSSASSKAASTLRAMANPWSIPEVEDSTAAVVALIAAAVVARLPAGSPDDQTFYTVTISIVLTTVLTGVFFFALGHFRLWSRSC